MLCWQWPYPQWVISVGGSYPPRHHTQRGVRPLLRPASVVSVGSGGVGVLVLVLLVVISNCMMVDVETKVLLCHVMPGWGRKLLPLVRVCGFWLCLYS